MTTPCLTALIACLQVEATCKIISETEQLKGGYNALGLSQGTPSFWHSQYQDLCLHHCHMLLHKFFAGGLFLRAVAERCQHTGPKMRTLVTLGSPHQGVYQHSALPEDLIG